MIEDRTRELERLYGRVAPRDGANGQALPAASENGHGPGPESILSDEEVIERCRAASNAAKFAGLFDHGSKAEYGGDHSRADQALVSIVAFYTRDPEQLDRLFRRSALYRAKWERADYRRRTIEKALSGLTQTYAGNGAGPSLNGHHGLSSPSPSPYKGSGRRDAGPEAVILADVESPGPRRYRLEELVPASYVTLLHGDGGVAKSLLVLAFAIAVALGLDRWLGRRVEGGAVLYVDFELDAEEQARRQDQVCRGAGIEKPKNLFHMSGVAHRARDVFRAAHRTCEELYIKLVVIDSYGVALGGDAEAARDVIGFNTEMLEPFRALGVAVVIIDHQSKMQAGQTYQQKGAFGSVFKSNLARSVIQVEATERGEGTLTVRLRQKKHNFGPLADPFSVKIRFSEEAVSMEPVELRSAELAEEATLNASDRVKLALDDGPAYPWEIAEATGLAVKTVKNALTGLRKQGVVEATGEVEGRTEQVTLGVPGSFTLQKASGADEETP